MIALDLSHHNGTGPVGQRQATINMSVAKAHGVALVGIRTNYGLRIDELATQHNQRADDAGVPRFAYWYPLSRLNPVTQAELAHHHGQGQRRGALDLEESQENDGQPPKFPRYSEDYFHHVNEGLLAFDRLSGLLTMLYCRASYMDFWFTLEQQKRWSLRMLWVAHWNTAILHPSVPAGWKTKPRAYELWQQKVGPFPGVVGNVDQNVTHPALTLSEFMGVTTDLRLEAIGRELDAIRQIVII